MTLHINGQATMPGNQSKTWGDVVASLDQQLTTSGDVVTAVRLDGVEEPAFRDPAVCAQPLASFRRIDIETGAPQVLARRCLGDAALALANLGPATRAAADGFRGDDVAQACRALDQISQGLMAVLRIVAAAGLALRRELDVVDDQGRSVGSLTSELDRIIRDLVDGQRNQDWLQVADILEYDLDPMLSGWRSVLTQVAAA